MACRPVFRCNVASASTIFWIVAPTYPGVAVGAPIVRRHGSQGMASEDRPTSIRP